MSKEDPKTQSTVAVHPGQSLVVEWDEYGRPSKSEDAFRVHVRNQDGSDPQPTTIPLSFLAKYPEAQKCYDGFMEMVRDIRLDYLDTLEKPETKAAREMEEAVAAKKQAEAELEQLNKQIAEKQAQLG